MEYLVLVIKEGFPKIVPYDPTSGEQRGLGVTNGKWTYDGGSFPVGQTRFTGARDRRGVIGVYLKDPSAENVNRIAMHFHECVHKDDD